MPDKMFRHEAPVRLHLTDAAGVLFFGSYFTLAHDAYESFMESIDCRFEEIFTQSDFLILIVHAEGDYKAPLYTGDQLVIDLTCGRLGGRSYSLDYEIKRDGQVVARMNTVHVCVDKESKKSRSLPDKLRTQLAAISPTCD